MTLFRSCGTNRLAGRPFRQRGISLVELMVALVLGLLVVGGVYRVYLGNQQSYRLQESLARVQENGRFAVQLLSRDMRQAAYRGGCGQAAELRIHLFEPDDDKAADLSVLYDIGSGVWGWEGEQKTSAKDLVEDSNILDSLDDNGYLPGSDVFLIKHAGERSDVNVVKTTGGGGGKDEGEGKVIHVDPKATTIAKGDVVVIADPEACDIFSRKTSENSSVLNPNFDNNSNGKRLSKKYGKDAVIMRYSSTLYYVGLGADGEPALRRQSRSTDTIQDEELISGVVDMQLRYGVDTDGDQRVDTYRAADHGDIAADWSNVLAVRVSLLLRSELPNVLPAPTTLAFDGGEFTAAGDDRRLYQVFTTTTGIRNRLP